MAMKKISLNNMSIKWKIFIFLFGFCAILLVLLWLFQVVFLESFYKHIKINEIKNSAAAIVKNIDSENLDELMQRLSINNEVCIEIITKNGAELHSSDILRDCIIHKMPLFEKMNLFVKTQGEGGELLEYFNRDSFRNDNYNDKQFFGRVPPRDNGMQESIIYCKIIDDPGEGKTLLLLNSVISPVNATVTTLRTQFYYIAAFMLLFSVILAFVIAKRVSKPIERLNYSAKILAQGNYETTFSGEGYKEISELSDTLNYTAHELSKVEALRRELIANISHDLRTPLTLIRGYAEAMRDLPDENNAENAQVIIDETTRLTTLVNDVLDLSKLQSGTQTINPLKYNLTLSISGLISHFKELVKKENYQIEFNYEREIEILADETRISQAIYNLLINAVNHTGDDKLVIVRQIVKADKVRIEVEDTGEGIAEADLPYIWDRYYKVDKIHKRSVTGTGLGLSIVKSTMDIHNGAYDVISKLNKGSIFWLELKL